MKRCSGNMLQIYKRTPMPKCNFTKVALWLFTTASGSSYYKPFSRCYEKAVSTTIDDATTYTNLIVQYVCGRKILFLKRNIIDYSSSNRQ